jgi:sulfite reductase (NADPH) flavoprotein alpha-component
MSNPLHPVDSKAIDDLTQLLKSLTPAQRLWVSGFVTGFVAHDPLLSEQGIPNSPSGGVISDSPITILFGSQTGNAEKLAKRLKERLASTGRSVRLESMAQYKSAQLKKEERLILVVSTHGEGDPPDNAVAFHRFLLSAKAPKTENLKYAVLALGDTSYEHFCKTGIDFDQRLLALGADPIIDRADCDVDFEDTANEWIERLVQELNTSGVSQSSSTQSAHKETRSANTYSRNQPYWAKLVENIPLTAPASSKEVRHIALSIADSGIRYTAGDALGVIPFNWPERVEGLLEALNLYHADVVTTTQGSTSSLESALLGDYEITTVTRPFLEHWATLSGSKELAGLLKPDRKKELQQWLLGREILDVIKCYPVRGVSAQQFVDLLRKIPPRLYSIASSWHQDSDEVHLAVGVVRYESHGLKRQGVASTYLSDRTKEGSEVRVYIHENTNFRLPGDGSRPILMIGPGTGVAPFRAFLQEREALGATGKNWLFFGDREFQNDFLYQAEWLDYRKKGLLNRIDVAFSRDSQEKVYVQHRIEENARSVYEWIEEGGHIYVCGDAKHMASDVHQSLIKVISGQSSSSLESAEERLLELQGEGRYQRDVY